MSRDEFSHVFVRSSSNSGQTLWPMFDVEVWERLSQRVGRSIGNHWKHQLGSVFGPGTLMFGKGSKRLISNYFILSHNGYMF